MDPVGLLAALVAVGAFPGGAYALAAAAAAARTPTPWRIAGPWTPSVAAGIACALLAAAQLPLPGNPAGGLPERGGAPVNLVALLLLLAAATALLAADEPWPVTRMVAAGAAVVPLLWLGAVTTGFAPTAVIELPGGGELAAARACTGLALLVSAPTILGARVDAPRVGRALILAVTALLALLLLEPVRLRSQPGAVTAGLALLAVGLWAALDHRVGERAGQRAAAAAALGAAAVTLGALAVR